MPPKQPVLPVPPKSKLGICSRILRPTQKTKGICWFLAVIVIMFYSQRSRRVIMEASRTWNRQNKVIKLFRDLLYDRYLTVGSDPYKDEEHETFNENTFVKILQELYDMDSSKFPSNPKDDKGYSVPPYLYKLYTLLGVDYKAFDYDSISHDIYYSSSNKEFDSIYTSISNTIPHTPDLPYLLHPNVGVYKDDGRPPSILIISRLPLLTPFVNNKIVDDDAKRELTSMKQKITYNGFEYNLDSVFLINMDRVGYEHAIVGMTCKQNKFIFNGHLLNNNKFPCILIPHNWNIRNDRYFYLSSKDCELHDDPQPDSLSIRYNFSQGYQRGFIYVRKNASRDTSHSKESDVEKYFETRKEAVILEEEIERARLLYDEKMRKKIEAEAILYAKEKEKMRLFSLFSEKQKKEQQERWRYFKEENERKKQEDKKKQLELQKEARLRYEKEKQQKEDARLEDETEKARLRYEKEKQQKEEELLIKEDNFASNLKNIEAFMANLTVDDRGKPKRKRKSSSNGNGSSPKLIPQPPKKQDRRASPKKAKEKAKTIIKGKRYIRKTMILG